jgi:hypothetical protein
MGTSGAGLRGPCSVIIRKESPVRSSLRAGGQEPVGLTMFHGRK